MAAGLGEEQSDLYQADANNSVAESINDPGTVVGYRDTGGGVDHAFKYSQGQMTDLHTLVAGTGYQDSIAYGINSGGQICGQIWDANPGTAYQAFWLDGTSLRSLNSSGGLYT